MKKHVEVKKFEKQRKWHHQENQIHGYAFSANVLKQTRIFQ